MNIVIPSYKRSNNIKTLDLLKNEDLLQYVTLFVVEEEYDAYRANYPDVKIIVGELGIVNQRNFISDYYNDGTIIISIDDDIENYTHREGKSMKVWLNDCLEYLKTSKCELISFPPSSNPFFCKGKEFSEGRYLAVGMFHIYKNDKHKLTIFPFLEDYERSLHYIHKCGAVIRYGFVCFKTKYFADGGCNITRTRDSYLQSVYKILHAYPNDLTYNIKKSGMMKGLPNVKINKKEKNLNVIQLPAYTQFEKLYEMFEKLNLRKRLVNNNRLGFPVHRGAVFGIIQERFSGKVNESLDTRDFPHVWEELKRIGNIICPFKWETIYVNKDLVCPPHKDKNNKGSSLLISFGNYTGGLIVVEGIEYNAYHTPTVFNGRLMEHWNTPIIGTKYSLVFY
jgi:hypothetical protein